VESGAGLEVGGDDAARLQGLDGRAGDDGGGIAVPGRRPGRRVAGGEVRDPLTVGVQGVHETAHPVRQDLGGVPRRGAHPDRRRIREPYEALLADDLALDVVAVPAVDDDLDVDGGPA
jgi:hypothetical protein